MRASAALPLLRCSFGVEGLHVLVQFFWQHIRGLLIVDSGATHSILDSNFLYNYKMKRLNALAEPVEAPHGLHLIGLGSSVKSEDHDAHGDRICLKQMRFKCLDQQLYTVARIEWTLSTLDSVREAYRAAGYEAPCGLLGSDWLQAQSALIDYAEGLLLLRPKADQKGAIKTLAVKR